MICLSHREALIELAATGGEPVSELLAHLHDCPSCRATLERERDLFASLDAHLRASADVEVPASLLPQVRVHLDAKPVRILLSFRLVTIALTAAAAVVLLLSVNSLRLKQPAEHALPTSRPASPSLTANMSLGSSTVPTFAKGAKKPVHPPAALQPQPSQLAQSGPEIIVSPEQEVLVALYADQLNQRRNSRDVVNTQSTSVEPHSLEMDLIQIAQLDVKPLAERPE
jgi:anti-sigma factor RsiW